MVLAYVYWYAMIPRGDDISGWLVVTGAILVVAGLASGLIAAGFYAVLMAHAGLMANSFLGLGFALGFLAAICVLIQEWFWLLLFGLGVASLLVSGYLVIP